MSPDDSWVGRVYADKNVVDVFLVIADAGKDYALAINLCDPTRRWSFSKLVLSAYGECLNKRE